MFVKNCEGSGIFLSFKAMMLACQSLIDAGRRRETTVDPASHISSLFASVPSAVEVMQRSQVEASHVVGVLDQVEETPRLYEGCYHI